MTFLQWLQSRLPASTRTGRLARRVFHALTPWVERNKHPWMLNALAARRRNVRFVQVGSNDSGYGDPLNFHTMHHGWRGLMIEPLPHIYERLRKRYAGVEGLQFANVAIDREPGSRPFYHLRRSDERGLPPWYDMLGSFSKENVLKHQKYLADIPERIVETSVRCQTFAGLCEEFGIERFDVLHIDAEGYDYEILKTIDLRRHQPTVVLYEDMHLSEADYRASLAQLHEAGYFTHRDHADTFAVRRQALEEDAELMRAWAHLRRRSGSDPAAPHFDGPSTRGR
jgi:FkbM family methyltransferase